MWQGLKTITDNTGKSSREMLSGASLPDRLNAFYAHFETNNTEICMRAPAVLDDCVITLSVADANNTFKQVNIHKVAGPDGLTGRVLRHFQPLPDPVCITFMFQADHHSPTTTVPKKAKVTCLNNYRP
jgi:hypothetical protein